MSTIATALKIGNFTFADFLSQLERQSASCISRHFYSNQELFIHRPDMLTTAVAQLPWQHGVELIKAAQYVMVVEVECFRNALAKMVSATRMAADVSPSSVADYREGMRLLTDAIAAHGNQVPFQAYTSAARLCIPQRRAAEAVAIQKLAEARGASSASLVGAVARACATAQFWPVAYKLMGALARSLEGLRQESGCDSDGFLVLEKQLCYIVKDVVSSIPEENAKFVLEHYRKDWPRAVSKRLVRFLELDDRSVRLLQCLPWAEAMKKLRQLEKCDAAKPRDGAVGNDIRERDFPLPSSQTPEEVSRAAQHVSEFLRKAPSYDSALEALAVMGLRSGAVAGHQRVVGQLAEIAAHCGKVDRAMQHLASIINFNDGAMTPQRAAILTHFFVQHEQYRAVVDLVQRMAVCSIPFPTAEDVTAAATAIARDGTAPCEAAAAWLSVVLPRNDAADKEGSSHVLPLHGVTPVSAAPRRVPHAVLSLLVHYCAKKQNPRLALDLIAKARADGVQLRDSEAIEATLFCMEYKRPEEANMIFWRLVATQGVGACGALCVLWWDTMRHCGALGDATATLTRMFPHFLSTRSPQSGAGGEGER